MGLFFSKKRSDGDLIRDGDPMMHIMPFLMRGRNESAIYYRKSIVVENMQKYVRDQRRLGRRVTMFNIIVSALLHTLYRRPNLNRFIAGRRIYQHKGYKISYIVKTNLTDDGIESIATVPFTEKDTIFSVTDRMKEHIDEIKAGQEKDDDKLIRFFARMPRWLVRLTVSVVRFLDFHGIMPTKLRESIPLYSSLFFSHLGSLGADAPFHHLYEFGTTSIFITIGKIYDAPYKNRYGELEWRKTMDLMFTIDERICDGFYLIRSLKQLEMYFDDPSLLETSPAEFALRSDEALMKNENQIVFERGDD